MAAENYSDAYNHLTAALQVREKTAGSGHASVADSLESLARLYMKKDLNRAERLFDKSLKIREARFGSGHPAVADSLKGLSELYMSRNQLLKLEPNYRKQLAIWESMADSYPTRLAEILSNLGWYYFTFRGNLSESEKYLTRSLTLYEKYLGPDHPETMRVMQVMSEVYIRRGRPGEAEPLLNRVERYLEANQMTADAAKVLHKLAVINANRSDLDRADELYGRSLSMYEEFFGAEHPELAYILNNYALLCRRKGQPARAEHMLLRSLAIKEKQLGPTHIKLRSALMNLAVLYMDQARHAAAEAVYKRAFGIVLNEYGANHAEVARVMESLVTLYKLSGNAAEADSFGAQAARIRRRLEALK